MKKKIILSIIIGFFLPIWTIASEKSDITTEQLVLLLRASSEQYKSISADIECKIYGTMNKNEKSLLTSEQIISKWTREKAYYKAIERRFQNRPVPEEFIKSYVISPIFSKRLEVQANGIPRGIIYQTWKIEDSMPFYGLYKAMWGFGNYPLDRLIVETSKITYDEVKKVYILNADYGINPRGTYIKFYIDPQKDFIPVWQDCLLNDGNSFMQYSCSDFRKTDDGLWVPYEYSWTDPDSEEKYFAKYTVQNAIINQPISQSLLDFDFPDRTRVDDERLGTTYRITKKQGVITDTNRTKDVNIAGVQLGTPATDEQLRSAALKARELLSTAGIEQKQTKKIEVFPSYVYVKPEKSEYIISVKSTDANKPELLSQSFESDKMKLVSLQNKISDKGGLVANIQRQPGDNGFEKGSLTLQFKEQKVEVIFVSPPIR